MRLSLLDAPSNLGLRPPPGRPEPGCARAPAVLRAAGLAQAIGAEDAGAVAAPPYRAVRDDTGHLNGRSVAAYARELAARVGTLLDEGRFPVVLGGDCSILLGNLLALQRRGRHGLAFVDGHLDWRQAPAPVGAIAGEDLAAACGHAHPAVAAPGGAAPLVRDADVVALGNAEWDDDSLSARASGLRILDADAVRGLGPAEAARRALERLGDDRLDGFWIHLDVDVLDRSVLPAVDSPNEDGLDVAQLTELLTPLVHHAGARGLEVTVFDPDLDPDGTQAQVLVGLLAAALGS
jgi:arginase